MPDLTKEEKVEDFVRGLTPNQAEELAYILYEHKEDFIIEETIATIFGVIQGGK